VKYFLAFLLLFTSTVHAELWHQPNNVGVAGGLPSDFYTSVNSPAQWQQALKNMDVYYLRLSSARKAKPLDLVKLARVLQQNNVATAIDTGGATWANCRNSRIYTQDIQDIKNLRSIGFNIRYIGQHLYSSLVN